MSELVFIVEEADEGGFTARALGESIFTEADTMEDFRRMVVDAVHCHFDDASRLPRVIRLHRVSDVLIPVAPVPAA